MISSRVKRPYMRGWTRTLHRATRHGCRGSRVITPRRTPTILARAGRVRVRHAYAERLGAGFIRVRPRISARLCCRIGVLRGSERRGYEGAG
jgi:hypothetical protein